MFAGSAAVVSGDGLVAISSQFGDVNIVASNSAGGVSVAALAPAGNITLVVNGPISGVILSNAFTGGSGMLTVDSGNHLYWNGTFIA
jgi:hypothetical protein